MIATGLACPVRLLNMALFLSLSLSLFLYLRLSFSLTAHALLEESTHPR